MTRRSGWILFSLGLLLALGAGVLVYVILQQQSAVAAEQARRIALEQQQGAQVPSMQLPVAARPLEVGRTVAADDFILKDFPLDLVPVGAYTDTTQIEGRVLARIVGQGETFQRNQFVGEQGSSLSQEIPQGLVLFAFPIVDLLSQQNILADGDRVDLLLSLPPPNGAPVAEGQPAPLPITALTLQNIQVFKVLRGDPTEENPNPPAVALLFAMRPADAVMLKTIKESGGTIDLVLRSPLDADEFDATPVDPNDVFDRYMRQ